MSNLLNDFVKHYIKNFINFKYYIFITFSYVNCYI